MSESDWRTPPKGLRTQQVVEGANRFGLRTFLALCGARTGRNTVLSPQALATGLLLVHAAATGHTRSRLAWALGIGDGLEPGWQHLSFGPTSSADAAERLISAVSLWSERTRHLKPTFLEDARAMGADLTPVDFGDASACAAMNEWVHARTGGHIDRLVDAGEIAAGTVLLILTVFYFKGRWAQPFDPGQTREGAFQLADGTEQRPPTMHRVGTFSYGELGGCEAVELAFASGQMAMRVLLPANPSPDENDMMEALFRRPHFSDRVGEVAIPRLRIDLNMDLVEALTAAGVGAIFSPEAEFGGMSDDRVWVGRVKQRATVTLDEEGTEAAAAASIQFIRSFTPLDFRFIVDRPFYWTIYDTESNLLLLAGFVADPQET